MRILFIEPRVNNPVRIKIALPMTFLSLYSYVQQHCSDVEVAYHSCEIDNFLGSETTLEEVYNKYAPDVVATSAVSSNFNGAKELLQFFKSKGCITLIGGLFPAANDRWVLENVPFIDIVFRGEGEETFVDVLISLKNETSFEDIKGISCNVEGKYIANPDRRLIKDLNQIPPLSYDKIPVEIYRSAETRYYVFASRGCNFACDFCTLTRHWQRKHRKYSTERVILEIDRLVKIFTPQMISFGDDTLSLDSGYFDKLCNDMANRCLSVRFGGKTRIDLIDSARLNLMLKAGFREISFGIETNDEMQLRTLNKGPIFHSLGRVEDLLREASDLGFRVNLNFILGVPGETFDSLKKKADFIIKHCSISNIVPLLGFLTPHWGSELHKCATKLGIKIIDENLDHYNHLQPVCVPDSLGGNGLHLLIETYNTISQATSSEFYNPLLEG